MGRPLNKKYFGNRNIGTGGYHTTNSNAPAGDDRIGGEGVASALFSPTPIADSVYTSGAYLDRMPSITAIGAPTIPGGVQAAAAVTHVQAVHGNPNVSGTPNGADYLTGDILTVTTGTAATPAKFTVGALQVSGFTIVAGNDGNTAHGYAVGDALNFDNGVILTVATINGSGGYPANRGVITSLTLTNRGSYTGTTPPTGTVGQTDPNQVGGRGLTVNLSWGVKDVTVLQAGDYTAVANNASATSVTHADLSASSAAGCTLDIWYGVKTITVSEKGSGYKGTETITFSATTDGSETRATGTIVLTTDSGAVGSATNQENAIIIRAKTTSGGTVKIGDIIKQAAAHRYKVKTADGSSVCKLVATDSPLFRQAYIVATASNGSTYYVTKITAHKAVLTYKSGTQIFANGASAPWSFTSTANGRVIIENA